MKIFSSKSTRHTSGTPAPKRSKTVSASTEAASAPVKKVKKPRSAKKVVISIVSILLVLAGLYTFVVYTNVPFIKNLRDAYIETAMSTMSHQWLAEAFFPQSVIDEVMSNVNAEVEKQTGVESKWEHDIQQRDDDSFYELFDEIDRDTFEAFLKANPVHARKSYMDIIINEAGLDDEGTSIKTKQGDQILAINAQKGVLLIRVEGSGYQGVLAVLKDSSKVRCCAAERIGVIGEVLSDFVPRCNGIIGINASGFYDADGVGIGGIVDGYTMCEGEEYGRHTAYGRKRVEFRTDNKMYIVDADASVTDGVRDAVEFMPALIIDGVPLIDEQSAYRSIQPRSCIGQSRDGDVLMLVIEGRLPSRSLGIGLPDCTEIMMRYDAYQAMNMDGGTSAVMWYDGEYVTKCSNPEITCRYLPNAWIYG